MDCLPVFSFPSANTTFTSASSPHSTPRKSSHRRQKAVEVPIVTTAKIRTPANHSPPRPYVRRSCRLIQNNLMAIPEGPAQFAPRPAASSPLVPSLLSPTLRPSCFRSTSAESVTTMSSSCMDSDYGTTPESCRFSNSNFTTSTGLEPFPRLSMCDIDEEMGADEDDELEFWCAGLEHKESLKSSAVAAMAIEDEQMKDVAFFDKIQAWRDSI